MEERIKNLENQISVINERNKKVEADKAWETSYFRIILISAIIYVIAMKVMSFIGVENYIYNALVPGVGYLISAQSLPFIKKWWIKHNIK